MLLKIKNIFSTPAAQQFISSHYVLTRITHQNGMFTDFYHSSNRHKSPSPIIESLYCPGQLSLSVITEIIRKLIFLFNNLPSLQPVHQQAPPYLQLLPLHGHATTNGQMIFVAVINHPKVNPGGSLPSLTDDTRISSRLTRASHFNCQTAGRPKRQQRCCYDILQRSQDSSVNIRIGAFKNHKPWFFCIAYTPCSFIS